MPVMSITLRPYQQKNKQEIYDAWGNGYQNIMLVSPTGSGKCLGKGTLVLMYDGQSIPVETLKPGQLIMGPDSKPRKILTICSGTELMYQITPVKGEPYIVNESHILSLRFTDTGKLTNISVRDYIKQSKTFKHRAKGWRTGVEFNNKKNLTIPPYILGVWLGDGVARLPSITNVDKEVLTEWEKYSNSINHSVKVITTKDRINEYRIVSNGKMGVGSYNVNKLTKELRYYKLLNNKHVPFDYLTSKSFNRLEVLAGIIDTDGYLNNGVYDIVVKQKQLANNICYLARSVGLAAYMKKCKKVCTNNGSIGIYYRTTISGELRIIPCRVSRRKAKPRQQIKNVLNTGITVSPIGKGKYFGFEIDGDGLFLLGDFTVTHNTVLFSDILREHTGAGVAIAHRQELVGQISMALARDEVKHKIIGPTPVIKFIINEQQRELGRSFYDPNAPIGVAGVDTLLRRVAILKPWLNQITKWVQDEGHHIQQGNKWGKAISLMSNALGLAVTATPCRADGGGLSRDTDGYMDILVKGPGMRELINQGYLTDYRIFAPPSDLDLTDVTVSDKTGDYNNKKLKRAVQKSHLVGDIVDHYLRIAPDKLGITFASDVETATDICNQFNARGVPAAVLSAKSPDSVRAEVLRQFRNREILQLINVDLFGEGFDLPAVEVVSMARPTQSYALYVQQFGRGLRIMAGKEIAIIIDHAGNVQRHGLPDKPRHWTIDRREKKPRALNPDDDIPLRYCTMCTQPFERIYKKCPYCGHVHIPENRSSIEFVDGDLLELSPDVLAEMRNEVNRIDSPVDSILKGLQKGGALPAVLGSVKKNHTYRQTVQGALRESITWWAAFKRDQGYSDDEIYKLFWFTFNTDMLTAQSFGKNEAMKLAHDINHHIGVM